MSATLLPRQALRFAPMGDVPDIIEDAACDWIWNGLLAHVSDPSGIGDHGSESEASARASG